MEKLGRPSRLLLKPGHPHDHQDSPCHNSPSQSAAPSRTPSRTASVDGGHQLSSEDVMYGDECCGGRVSLLHFCVIFLMAGVIILIVGAVQFKPEAELYQYRQIIVTIGCVTMGIGFALFAIKCTCFCSPKLRRNEKSSSSPATEAAGNGVEIKHQNGTKKDPVLSPILKHEGVDLNGHEMMMINMESKQVSQPDVVKQISKSEYENSDTIIQADVEICYSA